MIRLKIVLLQNWPLIIETHESVLFCFRKIRSDRIKLLSTLSVMFYLTTLNFDVDNTNMSSINIIITHSYLLVYLLSQCGTWSKMFFCLWISHVLKQLDIISLESLFSLEKNVCPLMKLSIISNDNSVSLLWSE